MKGRNGGGKGDGGSKGTKGKNSPVVNRILRNRNRNRRRSNSNPPRPGNFPNIGSANIKKNYYLGALSPRTKRSRKISDESPKKRTRMATKERGSGARTPRLRSRRQNHHHPPSDQLPNVKKKRRSVTRGSLKRTNIFGKRTKNVDKSVSRKIEYEDGVLPAVSLPQISTGKTRKTRKRVLYIFSLSKKQTRNEDQIFLRGSFDQWKFRLKMEKSRGGHFYRVVRVPPGIVMYRYYRADGSFLLDPSFKIVKDFMQEDCNQVTVPDTRRKKKKVNITTGVNFESEKHLEYTQKRVVFEGRPPVLPAQLKEPPLRNTVQDFKMNHVVLNRVYFKKDSIVPTTCIPCKFNLNNKEKEKKNDKAIYTNLIFFGRKEK